MSNLMYCNNCQDSYLRENGHMCPNEPASALAAMLPKSAHDKFYDHVAGCRQCRDGLNSSALCAVGNNLFKVAAMSEANP